MSAIETENPTKNEDGSYSYKGYQIEKAGRYWVADDPISHANVCTVVTLNDAATAIDEHSEGVEAQRTHIKRTAARAVKIAGAVSTAAIVLPHLI